MVDIGPVPMAVERPPLMDRRVAGSRFREVNRVEHLFDPNQSDRLSDNLLISQSLSGCRDAYCELVRRHVNYLFNLLLRMNVAAEDADDISQDTFLQAYNNLHTFEFRSEFRTWLTRIAINKSIDLHRRGPKKRERSLDDQKERNGDEARAPSDSDPELPLIQTDARMLLGRALEQLSEEHRIVLTLRELEGFTYAEIADIVGIEIGTVRSRLHRARKDMRRLVEELDLQDYLV